MTTSRSRRPHARRAVRAVAVAALCGGILGSSILPALATDDDNGEPTPAPTQSGGTVGGTTGSGSGASGAASGSLQSGVPLASNITLPGRPERVAGADRVATAIAISQRLHQDNSCTDVVVSTSATYADALGGARLASALGAPLLLNGGSALDPAVGKEIKRVLQAGGTIHVLGGEMAVSPDVASALKGLASRFTVVRIGGADRFATAVQIAQAVRSAAGTAGPIYVASGTNFPDGLVVAALAGNTGGVVLLTNGSQASSATSTYIASIDPQSTTVVAVGGPASAAMPALSSGQRVVGADRYATAELVAERFPATGTSVTSVGLATGSNWPDALTGSAAMGYVGGPLLLTSKDSLSESAVTGTTKLKTRFGGSLAAWIFGGDQAVSTSTMSTFGDSLKG